MAACRLIHRTGPRTGSRRLPNSTCAGCPRRSPCCEHWRWPTRCVRASACRCSRRCCRRRCSTCGWRAASRQRPPRCPPGVRGWAYVVRWTMTKLRLEQAPVAALPRRFLLTAPLWGMLAGVLLGIDGAAALVSRWNPATLALVHVFALGVLGNVMFGSILQFLPAAGGVAPGLVDRPVRRRAAVATGLCDPGRDGGARAGGRRGTTPAPRRFCGGDRLCARHGLARHGAGARAERASRPDGGGTHRRACELGRAGLGGGADGHRGAGGDADVPGYRHGARVGAGHLVGQRGPAAAVRGLAASGGERTLAGGGGGGAVL